MTIAEVTGNPRHDRLIHYIAERGYMNIEELAQLLDVSTQTIRRDIRKLSEQGLITRHHGGAGRISSIMNTAFEQRELSLVPEKQAIAEAVASYLPERCTVFITIGTTVEAVARALLNRRDLRIITNSLRVAQILYKNQEIEVMVPGGSLRAHNSGIIGPGAVNFIEGFRADYLITSTGAIEHDGTLLEFDVNEAQVARAMMKYARNTLLVADHTKFTASAAVSIGNAKNVRAFFTDTSPSGSFQQLLNEENVELIVTKIRAHTG
ncbi:DeoR/GlpR transcriptional regulator [Enterobacteriaceae bacterium BIT-l23]|uniref:DeoR/GlpR family DNA-binding transcription regulator n=1 Tax=Jejubacter sp. L23 TaxID=3092086 RepID=UPI0015844E55|nr:DeoR/GlpR transcriptional regulator [Enterobacteriaceae bacterium BIT-l23]